MNIKVTQTYHKRDRIGNRKQITPDIGSAMCLDVAGVGSGGSKVDNLSWSLGVYSIEGYPLTRTWTTFFGCGEASKTKKSKTYEMS